MMRNLQDVARERRAVIHQAMLDFALNIAWQEKTNPSAGGTKAKENDQRVIVGRRAWRRMFC